VGAVISAPAIWFDMGDSFGNCSTCRHWTPATLRANCRTARHYVVRNTIEIGRKLCVEIGQLMRSARIRGHVIWREDARALRHVRRAVARHTGSAPCATALEPRAIGCLTDRQFCPAGEQAGELARVIGYQVLDRDETEVRRGRNRTE